MEIRRSQLFTKHFKKRISQSESLRKQFYERLSLFVINPRSPILRNHPLKGSKKGVHAFSITGDIRIIYLVVSESEILLIDIGTHNQVYT